VGVPVLMLMLVRVLVLVPVCPERRPWMREIDRMAE
jgi:hypothetical protein